MVNDCPVGVCIKAPHEALLTSPSQSVIMSFAGKYQLESQENFEPFMKAIGKNLFAFFCCNVAVFLFCFLMAEVGKYLSCDKQVAEIQSVACSNFTDAACFTH